MLIGSRTHWNGSNQVHHCSKTLKTLKSLLAELFYELNSLELV